MSEHTLENFDGIDRTLDLLFKTTPFEGLGLTRANTVVGTIDFDKMLTDATGIMSQEAVQLLVRVTQYLYHLLHLSFLSSVIKFLDLA